jgi:hypothetical protein
MSKRAKKRRHARCFECGHKLSPVMVEIYKCCGCQMYFCASHVDYQYGHNCRNKDDIIQKQKEKLKKELGSPFKPQKINKI